jgi:glycosyltransferase involved in cell wall biosynthesis
MHRILYVVPGLRPCGPNQQLIYLIKYLDVSKFEPFVLSISEISKGSEESVSQSLKHIGVKVKSLSLPRLLTFTHGKQLLEKALEEIKPHLVHSQAFRADLLCSQITHITHDKSGDIPKISTVRQMFPEQYQLDYSRFVGQLMTSLHINALRKFDKIVPVSSAVGDNLHRSFSVNNIEVVKNGVDTALYSPVNDCQKNKLKENLMLPKSARIWVSTGFLSERKNPVALILAWQKIFYNNNHNHLVFLGAGPLEEYCRQICVETSNIHFVGYVENVSEYLKASDYYISASRGEGFPNSVLEAMACGLPVVLSDIPPHREIVEMDKKVGNLFELDNEKQLLSAINSMLASDTLLHSSACRSLVVEKLSAEAMSVQYQHIYTNLISSFSFC